MSDARIIAGGTMADGFRLIRIEDGDRIAHVLEVPDGQTALGEERWREFKINGVHLTNIFGFLVKLATKEQNSAKTA